MAPDDDSLTVPRSTEAIARIRRFVAAAAARAGFDARAAGEIDRAVAEVVTRAVAHRFSERDIAGHDHLTVRTRAAKGGFEIVIRDHGERTRRTDSADEIDMTELAREYDMGGFDEFVVKKFMDEVEFTHRPRTGNELRMVKWLPKRQG